ncbi:hypothetical protein GCM10009824_20560 [Kocuria atrinae]|uniref:Uncharacterized protein n=1 Tax=Kocuria atrinae TaxID=592377 RepID=A0ABN2XZC4_9MICC
MLTGEGAGQITAEDFAALRSRCHGYLREIATQNIVAGVATIAVRIGPAHPELLA